LAKWLDSRSGHGRGTPPGTSLSDSTSRARW
jgi:hypothetical protein